MQNIRLVWQQAWQLYQSDSFLDTLVAVGMAAIAGVLLFGPQLMSLVQRVS